MHVCDPPVRLAALLTSHWAARDIEAIVLLISEEIKSQGDAEDVLLALLTMRDKPMDEITRIIRAAAE